MKKLSKSQLKRVRVQAPPDGVLAAVIAERDALADENQSLREQACPPGCLICHEQLQDRIAGNDHPTTYQFGQELWLCCWMVGVVTKWQWGEE